MNSEHLCQQDTFTGLLTPAMLRDVQPREVTEPLRLMTAEPADALRN